MRYEFARLHQAIGATMVYVTHDQVEAMTLADRIVVLSNGRIEQIGTPETLYARPATLFVAGFIGAPRMNFMPVTLHSKDAGGARVRFADGTMIRTAIDAGDHPPGAAMTLGIRAEHVCVGGAINQIEAPVAMIESLGANHFAYLTVAGAPDPFACQLPERQRPARLTIGLPPEHLHLFDAGGAALARPIDDDRRAA